MVTARAMNMTVGELSFIRYELMALLYLDPSTQHFQDTVQAFHEMIEI